MDKTKTIGQKWLANELDLHFLALKKCTKFQSNRLILSKVIVLTTHEDNFKLTCVKFVEIHVLFRKWPKSLNILHDANTFLINFSINKKIKKIALLLFFCEKVTFVQDCVNVVTTLLQDCHATLSLHCSNIAKQYWSGEDIHILHGNVANVVM